jgi:hypothetical protein
MDPTVLAYRHMATRHDNCVRGAIETDHTVSRPIAFESELSFGFPCLVLFFSTEDLLDSKGHVVDDNQLFVYFGPGNSIV